MMVFLLFFPFSSTILKRNFSKPSFFSHYALLFMYSWK